MSVLAQMKGTQACKERDDRDYYFFIFYFLFFLLGLVEEREREAGGLSCNCG